MSNFEVTPRGAKEKISRLNLQKLITQKPELWGIPLALLAVFNLISKIFIISPAIVPDEYIYAKYSRLLPMAEAPIPDYLFYWVFGATKTCGPNFYTCGKAINILFFVGLAIIAYLIAKKALPNWAAWLLACLTLFSPLGYYSSFFMPEMMFYFACMIVVLAMLSMTPESNWKAWAGLGVLLGLASLTKPHALFLGLPIAILAIYLGRADGRKESARGILLKVSVAGLSTVMAKFTVGFAFAGLSGISLFGSSYTGTLTSVGATSNESVESVSSAESAIQVEPTDYLGIFFGQIGAHTLAILLMNVAAISIGYLAFRSGNSENQIQKRLFVVTISVLITGILTIGAFTSIVSGSGTDHSDRIMVRYYDYLVPISYLLLAISSYGLLGKKTPPKRLAIPAVIAVFSVFAMITELRPMKPNFYDGTSLDGFLNWSWLGWAAIAFSLALIFLATRGRRIQFGLAMGVVLPLVTLGSFSAAAQSLEPSSVVDRFDRAAQFTKNYLLDTEFEQLTVVSYESYPLSRALLQIDNARVDFRLIEKGETLDANALDKNKDWVLLIGDSFISTEGCIRQQGNGYQLIKLCRNSKEFFFNQEINENSIVSSLEGIGRPENWGAWTVGTKAIINFRDQLPINSKITLTMSAAPFAENQDYVATLGDSSISFTLDSEAIDAGLEFQNSSGVSQLIIEIPKPKSPKDAGQGTDTRKLGLQLYRISISK